MDHSHAINPLIDRFCADENLSTDFRSLVMDWYWPLSRDLLTPIKQKKIKVLGISGSQGSGKSTLAGLLNRIFSDIDGLNVVSLSLDDFYLTRSERQVLAKEVHPLFITRGVPGTHDIDLAISVINQLLTEQLVSIPRFDKARDDRLPANQWEKVQGPIDLVIFEGWCLSVPAQNPECLGKAQNKLEAEQDSNGDWRSAVNQELEKNYTGLFQLVDFLVYLQSPNFDAVKRWRYQQECKLANVNKNKSGNKIMDEKALNQFMQHYERLTRHSFTTLPGIADVVFTLNDEQNIVKRSNRH